MRYLRIVVPLFLGLGLWQGAIWILQMPSFILPSPLRVAGALWHARVILAENALITMSEVVIGLLLGAALGWITAVGLAFSVAARNAVRPLLVFSQAVPVFALAPIFTLWFGYGMGSKIAMALLIIYFPVTSSFFDALMRVPAPWLAQAHVMGARRWQVMFTLRIPAALPGFLSGLKLAAVYAPIGAIIGEWVGASKGLGYLMLLANGRGKADLMFAALIVLAVLTLLLHRGVDRGADWFLARRTRSVGPDA
ncbi:ABC transporter permease [Rhodobacteraceae bacterium]|nr:ABC transporter permease [Paracoccaceae bacterium]